VSSFAEVGKLDRGRSKNRPRDEPTLYGGKYPFIQTGDVANSNGQIRTHTQSYSEKGLAQSRMWPAGTLVITIAANIGKTAILTFPACFPDSLVGFIPGETVQVDYVRQWLVTMENYLEEAAPQMAQKNINLKILSGLTIPVPLFIESNATHA
jgi:type I restriction enzyme S subunit